MSTPDDPDDPLTGYDLHTWQAPPPVAGLTDTVIARMQAPLPAPVRTRSMRTISAAAGATLVAAAAVAALLVTHSSSVPPRPVATPMPAMAPVPGQVSAAGGGGADDAHMQAVEKRLLEVEVEVEELRNEVHRIHPGPVPPAPPAPPTPPVEPHPVPVVVEDHALENPFDSRSHHATTCDPFRSPHGCASDDPVACDADELVTRGDEALSAGSYSDALFDYEAAYACRPADPLAGKRAYLAACKATDFAKARLYFLRMSAQDQSTLVQICLRDGFDPRPPTTPTTPYDAPGAPAPAGNGTLQISSRPAAGILVDGADTKKRTPTSLTLLAGRHKVTFVLDSGDRYTYPLTVQPGVTTTLSKVLE